MPRTLLQGQGTGRRLAENGYTDCRGGESVRGYSVATLRKTGSISAGGVPIDIQHKIRSRKLQPCMLPAVVDMGNGQRGSIPGEDNWIPRSNHESNSPRGETSLSPFTVDISSYPFPRRSSRPSQCHKRQSDTRPFRISTSNLSSAQPC